MNGPACATTTARLAARACRPAIARRDRIFERDGDELSLSAASDPST